MIMFGEQNNRLTMWTCKKCNEELEDEFDDVGTVLSYQQKILSKKNKRLENKRLNKRLNKVLKNFLIKLFHSFWHLLVFL